MFTQLCTSLSHVLRRYLLIANLGVTAFSAVLGCADPVTLKGGPRVEETSSGLVVIGQTLELVGQGFLSPSARVAGHALSELAHVVAEDLTDELLHLATDRLR